MSDNDNSIKSENPIGETEIISGFEWQGIPITITYAPNWGKSSGNLFVSHIEVRADQKLPITETGYKSIFFHQEKTKLLSSSLVDDHVRKLIEEESQTKKWKIYWAARKQLSLFEE